jgi:hypothetical protein
MQKSADVALDRTRANELVAGEIRVMRGRNKVIRERTRHIMPYFAKLVNEGGIVRRQKE